MNSFSHRFQDIFFNAALKDGLLKADPTDAEITACWLGLTEEQRERYRYKPSGVLIEELPRLAETLGHPGICNTVLGPRSSLGAYELMVDIVSRLWPDPHRPPRQEEHQIHGLSKSDSEDRPQVHAERITIYDSIHVPARSRMPESITFSFGADGGDFAEERLFDLNESQLIEQVVTNPMLLVRVLALFGIEYPACWIITEMLTERASRSWKHPKPGDLDIIGGVMKDGRPDFGSICCAQVKIRKVKTLDETGDFPSGAETEQAHWTAKIEAH